MSDDLRPKRVRPLPRTPVALSVLNLLNERPMHPYEMRTRMRERGHDRAFKIRESSVYDTVTRLAERGFIEPVDVNREGRRPERTVYAITEAGRDELLVWMWELVSEPGWWVPSVAVAPVDHTPGHQVVRETEKWGRFPVEVVRVEPKTYAAFRWASHMPGADLGPGNTTLVEFVVRPVGGAVEVTVTESGFAAVDAPAAVREQAWKDNTGGWESELAGLRERAESA